MNKTYTMNNEVRNSFRRMLKDIAQNSDLRWTENTIGNQVSFDVEGCDSAVALVEKFNSKMNTIRMIVHTHSKFEKKLQKIADKLNAKFMVGSKENYFIVILDRSNQGIFHEMIADKGITGSVSCDGVAY